MEWTFLKSHRIHNEESHRLKWQWVLIDLMKGANLAARGTTFHSLSLNRGGGGTSWILKQSKNEITLWLLSLRCWCRRIVSSNLIELWKRSLLLVWYITNGSQWCESSLCLFMRRMFVTHNHAIVKHVYPCVLLTWIWALLPPLLMKDSQAESMNELVQTTH